MASAQLFHVVTKLPVKSGIVKDRPQFGLHFSFDAAPLAPASADFDNLASDVMAFLNTVPTGGPAALNAELSKALSTATDAVELFFYHVTPPGPEGAPEAMRTGTLGAVGATSLPEETAAVLSFRSAYGSAVEFGVGTRPRARLRNRIFIGPLAQAASDVDGTTFRTKVHSNLITIARTSAVEQLGAAASADGWTWSVYSPTTQNDFPVAFAAMDDAFDTQRRRGPEPTVRVEVAV